MAGTKDEQEERITKRHEKPFWGDRYVHYFDCGNGFMGLHINKISPKYNL